MGAAILSSLVKAIMGNLNSVALQEFGLAWGLKTELKKLESTLTTIQAVLQDAEDKQAKSEPVRNWLRKLRDAAYDADDLLDDFMTEALRQRSIKYQVRTFFSLHNPFVFRLMMGHKIKDIWEKLDAIAKERSSFHLREEIRDKKLYVIDRQHTSSLVTESEIYGRDEEKEMIIELLLSNVSNQDNVSIYAIFGMGGIGKTTLAQLVYNDARIESHFELRIWVCVSDDFEIRRLTRAILESIGSSVSDISELDPLQRRLEERLRGKRFLLILDDVWNEDHEKWDGLKHMLRCGGKRSTVIVTTRMEKVALTMATLPTHHLKGLSEIDCWSLFKQRAFGLGGREEHPNLVAIGKDIVKKCGGVALAVKALGSLMRFKTEESEWKLVKESDLWNLSDDECAILPALRLSYDHLPLHLKQCFAYCSIFPKDYKFEKDELIQLWMANGFILPKGQMNLHDVGHEIFNDLVWRSFFQDFEKDVYGNIKRCKMHDLVQDFAMSIMNDECFIVEPSKPQKIPERIRHLSFYLCSLGANHPNQDLCEVHSLRSLIGIRDGMDVLTFISKQNFLRVLDLNDHAIEKMPMSTGNLKHLRYLDLSYCSIRKLASMSCLPNLQTLKLKYCWKLCKLPNDMRHMSNLTYLDIEGCYSLTYMPIRIGQLNHLQKLSRFIVGKDNGRYIGELHGLNLRGELRIENLDNVRDLIGSKDANLIGKHNLQSLMLSWRNDDNAHVQANVEEILEGLQPHSNLKKLSIRGYHGLVFPHWMGDLLLPNLVEISLEDCARCEHLPPLGKLRFLKVLIVRSMDSVKYFDSEDYGAGKAKAFSALEQLIISGMPSLEEWRSVERRETFPCLRTLWIEGCPKLIQFPLLPLLENLTIKGPNLMLLRSVMNLTTLSSLEIDNFNDLKSLPHGLFQSHKLLKSLQIRNLPNLKSLSNELDNLVSLRNLELWECSKLDCLPRGLQNLTSLESINNYDCGSLTKLFPEEGLQGLSSLTTLGIQNCKTFMSLSKGFQYLTALQVLIINGCPDLTCLPESTKHLVSATDSKH